ncbi:MAG: histidinol-phosphate transaminase [Clostridia bacterium]|nr:histidinol-phosphate transaminase [Clostridia bacterium]
MSRFLDARFAGLTPYVPGEQPRGFDYIKLNTNELPYPPAPAVAAAAEMEARRLQLYSDPESRELKETLAEVYGLSPQEVFVSNGSDEILSFAFMAFCGEGRGAAFPDITYGFYRVYGELYGVDCDIRPLREDFSIDPSDYFGNDRMVVIANPNAPTGMCLSLADIREILRHNPDVPVLIDEAYVDFGGESALALLPEYDNLLVVRTFSKSRALAGGRLGFCFGSEGLIRDLETIKFSTNPYNLDRMTQAAGIAALRDGEYFEKTVGAVIKTREETAENLRKLGARVLPSRANFLFVSLPGIPGAQVLAALRARGILVRHFSAPRISDFVRITVGTPEQMDKLCAALADIINSEE